MGDKKADEETTLARGRALKRTPTRRNSTGSESVLDVLAPFQTPRLPTAGRMPGWARPKVRPNRDTDFRETADVEQWNATLQTMPLYGVDLVFRGEAMQAWVYEKRTTEGMYLCFLANGEAEKLPLEEIQRQTQEATALQIKQGGIYAFAPELMPSLLEFFAKYPREHVNGPPYTHWKQMFHLNTQDTWLAIRCKACFKLRRVALRFMPIVQQRQHEDLWRRCSMLTGLSCSSEETGKINVLDLKKFYAEISRTQMGGIATPTPQEERRRAVEIEPDPVEYTHPEDEGSQASVELVQYSPALMEMWRSLGKNLKQPAYAGEGDPNQLHAWREAVELFLQVYNVKGEAQVLAAVTFLQGEAEEWWKGLQATGRHRQLQTLEQLTQALKKRFFPLDRLERLAKQWVSLSQRAGVEEYREEFCLLQSAYPLGERAEFILAYQGLKPSMRAEVRQALDDAGQRSARHGQVIRISTQG